MTPRTLLAALEDLAGRLGVRIRAEPFPKGLLEGRGGLCRIDGQPFVVMDEKLSVPERIGVLASALASFGTGREVLADPVRGAIDAARAREARARTRSRRRMRRVPEARPRPHPSRAPAHSKR